MNIPFRRGLALAFAAAAAFCSCATPGARDPGPDPARDAGERDTRPVTVVEPAPPSADVPPAIEDAGKPPVASPEAGPGAEVEPGPGYDAGEPPPAAGASETVAVPASGESVSFKAPLAMGDLYLLRASGTVDLAGVKHDAEFAGEGAAAMDLVGEIDVGVDVGQLQIHAAMGRKPVPDGPGRMKWFGEARPDHVYYMLVTGAGKPLSLKLGKGAAGASGAITVALYPLSPPPPKLGAELEMVRVPVQKVSTDTKLVSKAGAIYVLQAAGAGGVGGGGLKLGDADYMDWTADGTGKNEGEAGIDFGVGVDEPVVRMGGGGPNYTPRKRWWGPWRADHVYYLLFVGTGKPITLAYHDTGYGDNSKTDALVVKIFAAP